MQNSVNLDEVVVTRIREQIAKNPVLLYMKGTPQFPQCGFSARAVKLLQSCEVMFAAVNILEEPDIRATLPHVMNWPTFPQLYIQGELIGGSDIMNDLYESGELKILLSKIVN